LRLFKVLVAFSWKTAFFAPEQFLVGKQKKSQIHAQKLCEIGKFTVYL